MRPGEDLYGNELLLAMRFFALGYSRTADDGRRKSKFACRKPGKGPISSKPGN